MKLEQLSDIVSFTIGKNPTRIKEPELILYSLEDFENDLYGITKPSNKSECIINLIKSKVAPVSVDNKDKCITSNFLKCEFNEQILDKWYFCYQFNEGKSLEQQIGRYHQGSTVSVKKLNIKSIGELKIPVLDIEKQRQIGRLYRQSIIQKDLLERQAANINRLMIETIRKMEEN